MGGIGILKLEDIMLPAFLSSVNSTSSLVNSILSATTTDLAEVAYYEEGIDIWNAINSKIPINELSSQRNWDEINILRILSSLNSPSDVHTAILTASLKHESSLWLSVLPSKNIGTLLDDNTFRISMALRLGAEMCHEYNCVCGVLVDNYGRHGLCCRKSYGKYLLHRDLNNIIHRTLQSANIPASLEPVGLFRDDGKRLDGMTLTPWSKGSCLVWDATCVDTLAASYINMTKVKAGRAAEQAALKKHNLCKAVKQRNYTIVPFAVESLGPWCEEAIKFTDELGKRLIAATGERRSKEFFKKNISLAIQRGNASKIMGSFDLSNKLNEIFYIL